MKNTLFTAVLCTLFLAAGAYADLGNSGSNLRTTRYWDACKPSCGWSGKPSENGVCASCNVSGGNARANNDKNACESGGTSYTCMGQAPWAVNDNLSYGFAASHTDNDCGKCFELTFRSNGNDGVGSASIVGKKMVVMISNIGGDVGHDQLDIMIPGGGVGQFNGLSNQLSQNGVSNANLGAQYGGFRTTAGNNPTAIRQMCDQNFGASGLSHLKEGCYWFVDWLKITNNPAVDYQKITCPSVLVEVYKGTQTRPSGGNPPPPTTTYTLTMSVSPTGGGTTSPASSQANIQSGTAVNISATPASGYTFSNWTVTSGTATFANANSQNTTVSLTANATVRANFTQTGAGTTYTLTVNRNPTAGGTTNPASSQANILSGTAVNISATPAAGYTFNNWTVVSGTASIANANSQNTTVTLTANATVRANFSQTPGGTTYTLTLSRSPSDGGSTTPSSQSSAAAGAPVSISATANYGYSFVNWTVTSGSATFADADASSTTVSLTSDATVRANFRQSSPGGGKTDTTKIEAESSTPALSACVEGNDNQPMCIGTSGAIKNIGYITSGNTASYTVNVQSAGAYTMEFRIALNGGDVSSSTFTVTVNGTQVGSITSTGTGGWDTYQTVKLSSDAQLNRGNNTIVLNFGNAINVDYFLLLGEATSPVRFNATRVKQTRTNIALTPGPRGFSAALPSNHSYTSYKLIDLRGREVRSGKIGSGETALRFDNIRRSVLLLKLEGSGVAPLTVKAVTY